MRRSLQVVGLCAVGLAILGGVYAIERRDNLDEPGITQTTSASFKEEREKALATSVLDDTQQTWREQFARAGKHYEAAQLVLFRDETKAACGYGQVATGPFFCPSDDKVYLDLAFNEELASRFGSKGDFAQAYVLAHEIGHHVQKLLGAAAIVKGFKRDHDGDDANLRLELQADCFAGVWAHTTDKRQWLEGGDIESAINDAAAIGNERQQHLSAGHVEPETFTHGDADQRVRWFKAGYTSGMVDACDTFASSGL